MDTCQFGNHTLYCGDSLRFLQKTKDTSIDAIITDPPYSSGGITNAARMLRSTDKKYSDSNKHNSFSGDNRDQRTYYLWLRDWLLEAYRVLTSDGKLMIFTDFRQYPTVSDALQVAGFIWQGCVVWDKTQGVRPMPGQFRRQAEYILFATKAKIPSKGPTYAGVITCNPQEGGKHHQTGKPLRVMDHIIQWVAPGKTICDPFMGAGSTGLTCHGRNPS